MSVFRYVSHAALAGLAAWLIACAVGLGTAPGWADDNIWADNLRDAKAELAASQDRLAAAQRSLAKQTAAIPRLTEELATTKRRAARLDRRYAAARDKANDASSAERGARGQAYRSASVVWSSNSSKTSSWRHQRSALISAAVLVLAVSLALILGWSADRRRTVDESDADNGNGEADANRLSLALGVTVAALLALLLVLLSAFDAFVFTWWAVLASLAVVAVPVCFALGWRRNAPLKGITTSRATAGVTAGAAVALLIVPIGVATATQAPSLTVLDSQTEALAIAERDDAPLPEPVQGLINSADRAESEANAARDDEDSLSDDLSEARRIRGKAQRQIAGRTNAVAEDQDQVDQMQAHYDDWEELQRDLDSYDTDPPPSAPDFDSGSGGSGTGGGSVGLCRDGTLSYSIGKQGACSHHGGVL